MMDRWCVPLEVGTEFLCTVNIISIPWLRLADGRPVTVDTPVRFWVIPCEIFDEECGN